MKIRLRLLRTSDNGTETLGTYSIFDENGNVMFGLHCLELAWKNNERQVSCISAKIYEVQKLETTAELATSRLTYPHFWIKNVPDRSGVKIHAANYVRDLLGCQAPGVSTADIDGDGQIDVTASKKALKMMLDVLPENFLMEITYAPNVLTNAIKANEKTV